MWWVICEIGPRLNVHISMTLLYTLDAGKMQSYDMTYILIQLLTLIEFKPHQKRQKSNLDKISKSNKHQPYYPIPKRICSRQKLLEKENFHLIRQDSHETQTNTWLCFWPSVSTLEVRVSSIIIQLYSFLYPLRVDWRSKHLEILLLSSRPHGIGPKGPPSQKGHPHLGIKIYHSFYSYRFIGL